MNICVSVIPSYGLHNKSKKKKKQFTTEFENKAKLVKLISTN